MITLDLPSGELRRHLTIQLNGSTLIARISNGAKTFVFVCDQLPNCWLAPHHAHLCMGNTVLFDLTSVEVERVREVFAPQGLRVSDIP